jgi:hypothetical protein
MKDSAAAVRDRPSTKSQTGKSTTSEIAGTTNETTGPSTEAKAWHVKRKSASL